MEINKKLTITVPIILLSIILAHVIWAKAQAASSAYEITSEKSIYSPQETVNINFTNLPTKPCNRCIAHAL